MDTPADIKSTCPYCGVGCGVRLRPDGKGGLDVSGDPDHPANFGRLCSKGVALGETVSLEGRLLHPQVRGARASWDAALDEVATRFSDTIAQHGPDSVAFYVSGQLLTEDYYVANKLMKGFIGSGNIDTNSRLCMASTVAGHKRAFGTDTVPGTYEDLDEADLVVLVGSNLAWCHPVLYQRLVAARAAHGTKIIVIDPRRTASCDIADQHLAIAPGGDVALFNGLLVHLFDAGAIDADFVGQSTQGFEATISAARHDDLAATGLDAGELSAFFDAFTTTQKVVTVFSQGVNQSSSGTDKVNAILNCHLATGRIGRAGMGPFSVTGQPNAMGGREVGGLANMLAAHLDIETPAHRKAVAEFWDAPSVTTKAGLKAVEMFEAVASGQIKALWIACTNPAVSMPNAEVVRSAIEACDFTVVSDLFATTDTARLADIVLPATGWGEKDGTVTNSDRTISRQRAALPPPGEARHDWDIFADVGRRMGWEAAFAYDTPAAVFAEHAALSGLAGQFGRDFDISALADMPAADYENLPPQRWPLTEDRKGGRFFADGQFFTPNGRANLVPVSHRPPASAITPRYPYRLNTGRARDQWHTMTRTGRSTRLCAHLSEPYLQIHPSDAADLGLEPADLALITGPMGQAILRVMISNDVPTGSPFAPIHWTSETAPSSRIGAAVSAQTDPVSGQPETKGASVAIEKYDAAWFGFAASVQAIAADADYVAYAPVATGFRAELAGRACPEDLTAYAQEIFGLEGQVRLYQDQKTGRARVAIFDGTILQAALFVAPEPVVVARDFVISQLGVEEAEVLAARPAKGVPSAGPTLCSCMGVGQNTVLEAFLSGRAPTVDAIGEVTGAGTNCGTCRAEIADLIAQHSTPQAAE